MKIDITQQKVKKIPLSWEQVNHNDPEQLKRQKYARNNNRLTVISLNKKLQNGVFQGTSWTKYKTSMESCTCEDFLQRKLPCKHIYRLAYELGIMEVPVTKRGGYRIPKADKEKKTPVPWDQVDHNDPEQIKRQKSALSKKLTPISIDEELKTGMFEGSSKDYFVTMEKCECVDFSMRKLPCKHIYRLAHELGIYNLTNATKEEVSIGLLKRDVPYTAEQIVESLTKDEAIFLKYLLGILKKRPNSLYYRIASDEPISTILRLEIIKEVEETPNTALGYYKIDDIKEMLKSRNLPVPTSRKWEIIKPLALEKISDLLILNLPKERSKIYKFSPIYKPIWKLLHNKLCVLYEGYDYRCEIVEGTKELIFRAGGHEIYDYFGIF